MNDLELLATYEPIVRFNFGELFFPTAVEDYVACCDLLERVAGQAPRVVVPRGELTLDQLAEAGAAHPGPGMYLRLVDEPFSRARTTMWRHWSERHRHLPAEQETRGRLRMLSGEGAHALAAVTIRCPISRAACRTSALPTMR